MDQPDFFLSSSEYASLSEPRRCKAIKRLTYKANDKLLLVRVSPPLEIGEHQIFYGLSSSRVSTVAVAPRFVGDTLFPINTWPLHVYVCVLTIDDPQARDEIFEGELHNHIWGELYRTWEEARDKWA